MKSIETPPTGNTENPPFSGPIPLAGTSLHPSLRYGLRLGKPESWMAEIVSNIKARAGFVSLQTNAIFRRLYFAE